MLGHTVLVLCFKVMCRAPNELFHVNWGRRRMLRFKGMPHGKAYNVLTVHWDLSMTLKITWIKKNRYS